MQDRRDVSSQAVAEPAGITRPAVFRLAWRLSEVAESLGISRRALERERAAGRFPKPDLTVGRMPLWCPETLRGWVEGGSR